MYFRMPAELLQLHAERARHSREYSDSHLPDIASCWILNCRLMVGFSSGLEVPACRLMLPFRLGSFWGFIFPTSHDSNFKEKKTAAVKQKCWNRPWRAVPLLWQLEMFLYGKSLSILPFILDRHSTGLLSFSLHEVPQKPITNGISLLVLEAPTRICSIFKGPSLFCSIRHNN